MLFNMNLKKKLFLKFNIILIYKHILKDFKFIYRKKINLILIMERDYNQLIILFLISSLNLSKI